MNTVNLLAVVVVSLVHFAIGMVWYSPLLFAKLWMELTGVKELKPSPRDLALGFLGSLITVYVLATLILMGDARSALDGLVIGIMVEIGFIGALLLGDMIFEKKPFKLFVLRNAYNLVALGVCGAILGVWH